MDANVVAAVGSFGVFFAGLLAGEELVVRYGVRAAIDVLGEAPHIELRRALIRRLRVLVPAIFGPTALLAVAVAVLGRADPGFGLRCAAVVALLVWLLVTAFGTVPINEAAIEWDPLAPPGDWRSLVVRWEQLNTVRCWAAMFAFACSCVAVGLTIAS